MRGSSSLSAFARDRECRLDERAGPQSIACDNHAVRVSQTPEEEPTVSPRRLVLFIAAAGLVAACGSSPVPSPVSSPAVSPSAVVSSPLIGGNYRLLGWRGTEVVLSMAETSDLGQSWIVAVDTTTSSWQARSLPSASTPGGAATDGTLIAFAFDNMIIVENAKGVRSILPGSPDLPAGWGAGGLVARHDGGFVVRGAGSLITVDARGTKITVADLPSGMVLAATTSDPATYLLAPAGKLDAPGGMELSLWQAGDTVAHPIVGRILAIATAIEPLAYLQTSDRWMALAADGSETSIVSIGGWVSAITPDGDRVAFASCEKLLECPVSVGPIDAIVPLVGVSPTGVAAMSFSRKDALAVLGPDPISPITPPYFTVVSAKGVPVEYSLPTVALLTPPAP